jgi:DNA repair protein RadC
LGKMADVETVVGVYGPRLAGLEYEVVIAIALDGQNRLLAEFEVARGGKHGAALTPADVLRPVIRAGASALLLLHNHPSGDPTPSREDCQLTRALRSAATVVGIPLLDHIIVAARYGGHVSFLQLGLLG